MYKIVYNLNKSTELRFKTAEYIYKCEKYIIV